MQNRLAPESLQTRETLSGVGLGLRRDLIEFLLNNETILPRFVECAPENWMGIGGYWLRKFKEISERYRITAHGLSLSLGSPEPLDWDFLSSIRDFLNEYKIEVYTEHLSYSKCSNAHLYDLLPIPFREDAIEHVSTRIKEVQNFLEREIAIENVSYYASAEPQMTELDFITAILEEAECHLLLDVNNVYVNAFNHKYDAKEFISKLPLERVRYIHMAGHERRSPDLIIDTHGAAIIDPVYDLFAYAVSNIKPVPILLERDHNFPKPDEIYSELQKVNDIANSAWGYSNAA